MEQPLTVLHSVFGYTAFRPGQAEIIEALLAEKDVLAILPTGAGKSLCFQVPGLCKAGTCFVISPLISLMQDQVQTLKRKGVAAEYLSSTQSEQEREDVLHKLASGQLQFIYVAPERLLTPAFLLACKQSTCSQLIIDEAHCISIWGNQFRPEYRNIGAFRAALQTSVPTAAFTATATPEVVTDICSALQLQHATVIKQSFARPNLSIYVYPCESHTAREIAILRLVKKYDGKSGIVYAATRSSVTEITTVIQTYLPKITVSSYHAGMTAIDRKEIQNNFLSGKTSLIVATTAFGMGIDKSDVRYVLHYQLPASIENYYQEIGRAGRDGEPSDCYLLTVPQDAHIQLELIKKSGNPEQQLVTVQKLKHLANYVQSKECYHQDILQYFGEKSTACATQCSNCCKNTPNHELLYGLSNPTEIARLQTLLMWRASKAERMYLPERAILTDKQLCKLAFDPQDFHSSTTRFTHQLPELQPDSID